MDNEAGNGLGRYRSSLYRMTLNSSGEGSKIHVGDAANNVCRALVLGANAALGLTIASIQAGLTPDCLLIVYRCTPRPLVP